MKKKPAKKSASRKKPFASTGGRRHTREQKRELVARICELYQTGKYTLESCCVAAGTTYDNFRKWVLPSKKEGVAPTELDIQRGFEQELHDMYQETALARPANYLEHLKEVAQVAALRKVEGYEREEVESIYAVKGGRRTLKGVVVKKKHIPPSDTLLTFTLRNLMPDAFQERQTIRHEGSITTTAGKPLEQMTLEELEAEEQRLLAAREGKSDTKA